MTSNIVRIQAHWHCTTRSEHSTGWSADLRKEITNAAQGHQWDTLLNLLTAVGNKDWVNAVHLDDPSFDTPLHEAARGGAPEYVIQKLIELKAFRTIRNAQGKRPIDVARDAEQTHLYSLLEPALRSDASVVDLEPIQQHFHILIHQRAPRLKRESIFQGLWLPELEPLLETNIEHIWCRIPSMYGGFKYWLDIEGNVKVLTESHSRISWGSEQFHKIDAKGIELMASVYWEQFDFFRTSKHDK